MPKNTNEFFIHNNKAHAINELQTFHELYRKKYYYEVIRIIEGVPLFFKDHMKRFKQSIEISGDYFEFTFEEIKNGIKQLIEINNIKNANLKIIITIGKNHRDFFVQKVPHYYPTNEEYKHGIKTNTWLHERYHPTAKVWDNAYKQKIKQLKSDLNVFEILLLNEKGQITEGSITNFFYIKGNKLFTAPKYLVLPGITRKHVLKCCKNLGIKVKFKPLKQKNLTKIDAAFITGTSSNVLPVSSINDYKIDVNHSMLLAITEDLNKKIRKYIEKRKSNTLSN